MTIKYRLIEGNCVEYTVGMVFLLNFQNIIYIFVDVIRSFDLIPNPSETVPN